MPAMLGKRLKTPPWIKNIGKRIRKKKDKEYVADPANRSWSDNGRYIQSVIKASQDDVAFRKFKRDRFYLEILECVPVELGAIYLDVIRKESPDLLKSF